MTLPSTLRLDRLALRNFRCFADCLVELHPQLTVLVAENGRGKTAVLDAIGISLGLFVDTIAGTHQSHGFERSDVRLARAGRSHAAGSSRGAGGQRLGGWGPSLVASRAQRDRRSRAHHNEGRRDSARGCGATSRAAVGVCGGRSRTASSASSGRLLRYWQAVERASSDRRQTIRGQLGARPFGRLPRQPLVVLVF